MRSIPRHGSHLLESAILRCKARLQGAHYQHTRRGKASTHPHILSAIAISQTAGTLHILLSQSSLLRMTAPQSDSNSDTLDSISESISSTNISVDDEGISDSTSLCPDEIEINVSSSTVISHLFAAHPFECSSPSTKSAISSGRMSIKSCAGTVSSIRN